MSTTGLERDDLIRGGIALLLAIDLLFLPWFDYSYLGVPVTTTATDAPQGILGILAAVAALAFAADLGVERWSEVELPALGGSRFQTRRILAIAAAALVALKFLFHIDLGKLGLGFWLSAVLSSALVVVTTRPQIDS
jgi:hypothetical protein